MSFNIQHQSSQPADTRRSQALWIALLLALALTSSVAVASTKIYVKNIGTVVDPSLNGAVATGSNSVNCTLNARWLGIEPHHFIEGTEGSTTAPLADAFLYFAYADAPQRHLYVGIDVKGDEDLSDNDLIIIVFDANNNNTWDSGDFYIEVQASNVSTSPGLEAGTQCNQPTGIAKYWEFDPNAVDPTKPWRRRDDVNLNVSLNRKLAYDYDATPDPDREIWNVEIDIPIGAPYFNLQTTSAPFFAVGAYVFVDWKNQQEIEGDIVKWPEELPNREFADQQLAGSFSPTLNALDLADVDLQNTCLDVNFTVDNPWELGTTPLQEYDHSLTPCAENKFYVTFKYEGPVGSLAKTQGIVKLELHPYGGGGGQSWVQTVQVNDVPVNSINRVEFVYDFGHVPSSLNWPACDQISFVCATMTLENFTFDDDHSNNYLNVNYNYFHTSYYAQTMFISGDQLPNLRTGDSATMLIRMQTANDPQAENKGSGGSIIFPVKWNWHDTMSVGIWLSLFGFYLLILWLSLKLKSIPAIKRYVSAFALITIMFYVMVQYSGCTWWCFLCPSTCVKDRCQIKNAGQLGLQQVKGEHEWYRMPLKKNELKQLQLQFTDMTLPYQTVRRTLRPALADGTPNKLQISVNPGTVLAVIAFGQLDLDGSGPIGSTSAAGIPLPRYGKEYLLRQCFYTAHDYAGALIGSFNNFETSFLVGRSIALVIPAGARTLSLAVNAPLGQYSAITGSYDIVTIERPENAIPAHTIISGDDRCGIPQTMELWEVLTSLNISVYYETVERNRDGSIRGRTMHPYAFAHQIVYQNSESSGSVIISR
jgi:hypothetical protein